MQLSNQMDFTYAINREFHRHTEYEFATELQAMIRAQPVIEFASLAADQIVYYKGSYSGDRDSVLQVVKSLPSGKMVDVHDYGGNHQHRIRPTHYHGTFYLMNDELLSYLGMKHEQVIAEAIRLGLDVPARVRIYHPRLFVELPERFKAEELERMVRPQWGRNLTAEAIDEMIANRHASVRQLENDRLKAAALNPEYAASGYAMFINDHHHMLDFLYWLRPHVDAGGVFHIEKEQPK